MYFTSLKLTLFKEYLHTFILIRGKMSPTILFYSWLDFSFFCFQILLVRHFVRPGACLLTNKYDHRTASQKSRAFFTLWCQKIVVGRSFFLQMLSILLLKPSLLIHRYQCTLMVLKNFAIIFAIRTKTHRVSFF